MTTHLSMHDNKQRTSDSLNDGLPIKMTREKFQRKRYLIYEKDSRFNPRLIHKSSFIIGQVPIEKYGLILHLTSYKNGMIGHGGTLSKCSKTLCYKSLLKTYFVKTCR